MPYSFTPRSDGTTIFASHLNELQDAIETLGGVPALAVAASDSPSSVKARADYVCDGAADDVEINAAINTGALAVLLSEGTFYVNSPIVVNNNRQTLVGQGSAATEISPGSSFPGTTERGLVEVAQVGNYRTDHRVMHLRINGLKSSQGTKRFHGLKLTSYRGKVFDIDIQNCPGHGLFVTGPRNESGNELVTKTTDTFFQLINVGYCLDDNIHIDDDFSGVDTHWSNIITMHAGKQGSTIVQAGSHGIFSYGTSMQIHDLHSYGNTGAGVWNQGRSSRCKWTNCKIEMSTMGQFIAPQGLWENIFVACGFRGGDETQVQILGSSQSRVLFVGCTFSGDDPTGPRAPKAFEFNSQVSGALVTGCLFMGGYTTSPIYINSGSNNVIVSNSGI